MLAGVGRAAGPGAKLSNTNIGRWGSFFEGAQGWWICLHGMQGPNATRRTDKSAGDAGRALAAAGPACVLAGWPPARTGQCLQAEGEAGTQCQARRGGWQAGKAGNHVADGVLLHDKLTRR